MALPPTIHHPFNGSLFQAKDQPDSSKAQHLYHHPSASSSPSRLPVSSSLLSSRHLVRPSLLLGYGRSAGDPLIKPTTLGTPCSAPLPRFLFFFLAVFFLFSPERVVLFPPPTHGSTPPQFPPAAGPPLVFCLPSAVRRPPLVALQLTPPHSHLDNARPASPGFGRRLCPQGIFSQRCFGIQG